MAQLEMQEVCKTGVEIISIKQYIDDYQPGLTAQAVSYAMEQDHIDYIRPGHERLIVLTEKTKNYTPNESVKRDGDIKGKGRKGKGGATIMQA